MPFISSKNRAPGIVSVTAALVGNVFVTIIKFVAFLMSGSSALFSEVIHGLADTANQSLLLIGIIRSRKKPTKELIYGYGLERFFWSLISACGIFFIGAGITVYYGISSLLAGIEKNFKAEVFIFLAISFVVELITFLMALRELRSTKKLSISSKTPNEPDPTVLAVAYEDGVAVLGSFIALISIYLSYLTDQYYWDSIGSIIIGLLLGFVAVELIIKNRQFLVGKTVPMEIQDRVVKILESDPMIEKVLDFKSSVISLREYRIKCEIEINGHSLFREVANEDLLKSDYDEIKNDYESFLRLYMNIVDRVPRVIGTRIDKLENRIQKEIPSIRHIDLEIN